ncbi:MAG: carboxypeptidase regulatory-like domain-containing protein [Lysobacterales bacterium]
MLGLMLALVLWQPATSEDLRGQPLSQVIQNIAASAGLSVLYTEQLIPDFLRVTTPISGTDALTQITSLVSPYGLQLTHSQGSQWLITRRRVLPHDTVTLSGRVHNELGDPVSGARVTLAPAGQEAVTDSQGVFRFSQMAPDFMAVRIEAAQFEVLRRTLTAAEIRSDESLSFSLTPVDGALSPIVVTASYYGLMRTDQPSHQYLSREQIDQLPHIADDVFRAARWLPGIASADIGAQLNVRGGASDELLVVLDGMRIYEPFHLRDLLSLFSIVDSNIVDGVDLYAGAFPAHYGGVNSGVLDIQSRTPDATFPHRLGLSFTNAFAQTSGEIGAPGGYWLASARTGYLDVVLDLIDDESGLDPTYFDALAKFNLPVGKASALSGSILLAGDQALVANDNQDFSDGDYRDAYGWLTAETSLSPYLLVRNRLLGGYLSEQRQGQIDDGPRLFAQLDDARRFRFAGVGSDWEWERDSWKVRAGLEWRGFNASYRYQGVSVIGDPLLFFDRPLPQLRVNEADLKVKGSSYSAYTSVRKDLLSTLAIEAGLRWDKQTYLDLNEGDNSQISPRFSAMWQFDERSRLRLAWGQFHQPIEPNQLMVTDGENTFSEAQQARQWVVALEHRSHANIDWRLEVYKKKYTSVRPYFENPFYPTDFLGELEADRTRISPDRSEARGAELSVNQTFGSGAGWWGSYTYSSVEDLLDQRWVPRSWDQRHAVSLGATVPIRKWTLTVAWRYHSGWPQTPFGRREGEAFGFPAVLPDLGPRNSSRSGIYHRMDLRASREIPIPIGKLRFYLELLNVYNRRNDCCDAFDYFLNDEREVRFTAQEDHWLPFVPSLGLKWEF